IPLAPATQVDGARGERHEGGPVAPVDGNIIHLFGLEDGSKLSVGVFEHLSCALYFDPRYGRAHLEPRVHGAGFANEELDPLLLEGSKSFVRDREIVRPDWQVGNGINSGIPGLGLPFETSAGREEVDSRLWDARPTGVCDGAGQRSTRDLGLGAAHRYKDQQGNQNDRLERTNCYFLAEH